MRLKLLMGGVVTPLLMQVSFGQDIAIKLTHPLPQMIM
jgi:hypothetical protein